MLYIQTSSWVLLIIHFISNHDISLSLTLLLLSASLYFSQVHAKHPQNCQIPTASWNEIDPNNIFCPSSANGIKSFSRVQINNHLKIRNQNKCGRGNELETVSFGKDPINIKLRKDYVNKVEGSATHQGAASLTVTAKSSWHRHFNFNDVCRHRHNHIFNQMTTSCQ